MGNTKSDNKSPMPTTELKKRLEELEAELEHEKENHRRTKIKLKMRENENHAITHSNSYKLAKMLATAKMGLRYGVGKVRAANPRRVALLSRNRSVVRKGYNSAAFQQAFTQVPSADTAVIIHLYYDDMLPLFAQKLRKLASLDYDVYVTIPTHKKEAIGAITKSLPGARVAVVPNCGRDVLPFVMVMRNIEHMGYSKILKLHSKKSPHRTDGTLWRDKIIDNLIPSDIAGVNAIQEALNKKNTAIIGPGGEYVSMLVNLSATERYVRTLATRVVGQKASGYLMRSPDEFGFFGGTMFWARCDALLPVVHSVKIEKFEPELGQEDSTLAHALERLLNVIPELQGKDLYEIENSIVRQIAYETTNIPLWSEVAIDD